MPPVPPDIVRVQLTHEMATQDEVFVNTFHLRRHKVSGLPTDWANDVVTTAVKVRDKYAAAGRPLKRLPSSIALRDVGVYHLRESDGRALEVGRATSGVTGGDGSLPVLPFDVAAVVTLETVVGNEVLLNPETGPNPSRRARGRVYMGPLASGNLTVATGRWDPGSVSMWLASWEQFFEDVQGMHVGDPGVADDHWDVVVLSRTAGTARQLTRVSMDDLPDTQRRRSNRQVPNRTRTTITQH